MSDTTKRELRQQKREQKRAGVKFRRRELKRSLLDDPDEAPYANPDLGYLRTAPLNGNDHDAKRKRTNREDAG